MALEKCKTCEKSDLNSFHVCEACYVKYAEAKRKVTKSVYYHLGYGNRIKAEEMINEIFKLYEQGNEEEFNKQIEQLKSK